MEIDALIRSRRTVHKYQKAALELDTVKLALESAQYAPNHKLTYPWKFYLVGERTRQQIFDLACELKPNQEQKLEQKLLNPSYLIFVTQKKCADLFQAKEDYAACACAVQNFCLSLWEKGVGTKWGTGGLTRHPHTYDLLNINSDNEEIIGLIYVGQPLEIKSAPTRPPLEDVLVLTD